jgi:nucleotide-binding universal stress UspA family protein
MTIKALVVLLDATLASVHRLDLAVTVAARFGAHLVGLHVVPPPTVAAGLGLGEFTSPQLIQDLMRDYEEQARKQAEAIEASFEETLRRSGLGGEWRRSSGDPASEAAIQGRAVDLVVIGQGAAAGGDPWAASPSAVSMACGRPVLAVPFAGQWPRIGRRVLVAWDGSREASRAVNDALPFLQAADAVTVLSIEEEASTGAPRKPLASEEVTLHLSRHGVPAEAAAIAPGELSVGEALLSQVAALDADLLVMGCYGHSRFREIVLGGVSRTIERSMPVPVLMSH